MTVRPNLQSPITQGIYEFWLELKSDKPMPGRGDIRPQDIDPHFLPNIILFDVLNDPYDFRYRLVGTRADHYMTKNYTGICMSELPDKGEDSILWRALDRVVKHKEPTSSTAPYVGPFKDFTTVEDVLMPLSDNGGETINMIFAGIDFMRKD